MIIILWKAYRS